MVLQFIGSVKSKHKDLLSKAGHSWEVVGVQVPTELTFQGRIQDFLSRGEDGTLTF